MEVELEVPGNGPSIDIAHLGHIKHHHNGKRAAYLRRAGGATGRGSTSSPEDHRASTSTVAALAMVSVGRRIVTVTDVTLIATASR